MGKLLIRRGTQQGSPSGYQVTGPATGAVGVPATFVVSLVQPYANTVITPHDSLLDGTFNPASLTLTDAQPSQPIDYTAATSASRTLVFTNNRGLPIQTKLFTPGALDTTKLETYLMGGLGEGLVFDPWQGWFNHATNVMWPTYRDGGPYPGDNGTVRQYDLARCALNAYHFLGQIRGTWDARLIAAADADARVWHKYYVVGNNFRDYTNQSVGLRMLYQLNPDVYDWCLPAIQHLYDWPLNSFGNRHGFYTYPSFGQRRELYCREWAYNLLHCHNWWMAYLGWDNADHNDPIDDYNHWLSYFFGHWPYQWMDEYAQPGFGGFADPFQYSCHCGNFQTWAHWPGPAATPNDPNLVNLDPFFFGVWFDTAISIYEHDPQWQGNQALLANMIRMANYLWSDDFGWNPATEVMYYRPSNCHVNYYGVAGHGQPAAICASNQGWGDVRALNPVADDLAAFGCHIAGFLYHVTADPQWLVYGDRLWYSFWANNPRGGDHPGDPLYSYQLTSAGGKQFTESITHLFKYLKWRDYPDLFCDIDARWSPTYEGAAVFPS